MRAGAVLGAALVGLIVAAQAPRTAWAQGAPAPDLRAAPAADSAEARPVDAAERLAAMARFMAGAERFAVTLDTRWDAVQENGARLEFAARRTVLIDRPAAGLRVDATESDGRRSGVRFDGRRLVVFDRTENVYGEIPLAGTVDDAFRYLVEELRVRMPLALLFLTGLPDAVTARARSVARVETSRLTEIPSDHLFVTADGVDVQVWIAQGDRPFPLRVVLTYRDEPGAPQFRADLIGWDFAPDAAPARFAFAPAAGAERIPFMIRVDGGTGTPPASEGAPK